MLDVYCECNTVLLSRGGAAANLALSREEAVNQVRGSVRSTAAVHFPYGRRALTSAP